MLVVKLNEMQFEYDIHSLVKAFYPGKEVKVLEEGAIWLRYKADRDER